MIESSKDDVLKRLRRIEGQIKGIHKMIDGDQCCNDVLVQVAAARAAITKVGGIIMENYSKECIKRAIEQGDDDDNIENLINTIIKYSK
jgi:CsoR family transcriptional regulator, copper-sensing transcriptional repressor